jgi:hypothetical protein
VDDDARLAALQQLAAEVQEPDRVPGRPGRDPSKVAVDRTALAVTLNYLNYMLITGQPDTQLKVAVNHLNSDLAEET